MGPKRVKTGDDSEDHSAPEFTECIMADGENRQLSEISEKLSIVISTLHELTAMIRESAIGASENTLTVTSEISKVVKNIEENIQNRTIPNPIHTGEILESRNATYLESEAMKIKAGLAQIWARKLRQRIYAYWAFVNNKGTLFFHEKWTAAEGCPIIIPRKFQKFEMNNENVSQRQLRERGVAQDFKMEIEMEHLRVEACLERARKLDQEMVDIIKSKCTGQVCDFLLNYWMQDIKRNEEISQKRWLNKEKWLKKYEEDFIKEYENKSPFFKQRRYGERPQRRYGERQVLHNYQQQHQPHKQRRSYAEVARSTPLNHGKPNHDNVQDLLQELLKKLGNNQHSQVYKSRAGSPQRVWNNHQNEQRRQNGRFHRGRQWGDRSNNGRFSQGRRWDDRPQNDRFKQRRRWGDRSNNSVEDSLENVVEHVDYFRQADHNWHSQTQ